MSRPLDPRRLVVTSLDDLRRQLDEIDRQGDEAWRERNKQRERATRDEAVDRLLSVTDSTHVKARGGRPQEVTLPMLRGAMAELVNGYPRRRPTQEAVQSLRGWDRKTIRARAHEYPGGWVALRRDVEAAGE